jgi:hypothetical protein
MRAHRYVSAISPGFGRLLLRLVSGCVGRDSSSCSTVRSFTTRSRGGVDVMTVVEDHLGQASGSATL